MSSIGLPIVPDKECENPDLRNVDKVREIFRSLSKYIISKQIYTSNNPNLSKFAMFFKAACDSYFEVEDELLLKVEQYHLAWRGQTVYENEKRDESIAFLLYKDGVGEISIQGTVTFRELERFVDIIKDETHNYSLEVDIVTKLWNAEFEDIRYRVFDNDLGSILGEGQGEGAGFPGKHIEADDHEDLPSFTDKGRIAAGSCVPDESIGEYICRIVREKYHGTDDREREMHVRSMLTSYLTISDEEKKYFEDTIAKERNTDKMIYFIGEILGFARIPGNSTVAGDVRGIIECLIQHLINEDDVSILIRALEVIKDFTGSCTIPDECRSFFKHIEEMLTDNSMLRSLGKIALRSKKDSEDVLRYYRLVGKRAVPALCAMLEDSNADWLHTEACRMIVDVAGDDIHHIMGQLDMDKPHIAQDIIHIFRELQLRSIPSLVNELMYYPDPDVKWQVIQLLVHIGNDEAAGLLAKLLDDDDMHIRIKTLGAVEEIRNPIIIEKITSFAFDTDLELKSMEEQERIFRALGKLAGEKILPRIESMIRKRKIFFFGKRGPDRHKKILAIRALEHIHCSKSLSLLGRLAHDKDTSVKSMAIRGLKSLEQPDGARN